MMDKVGILVGVLAVSVLTPLAASAIAATSNVEKRVYDILVDNKPAGSYELTLTKSPDGTVDVQSRADVAKKILWKDYRYKYRGHELWHGDKFVALESDSTDDGKRCVLKAEGRLDGIHVFEDGKERVVAPDTVTSSYWCLPPNAPSQLTRQFLEVDSGRVYSSSFKKVGDDSIACGARTESCKHYKVTGGDSADVWYDSQNRLVKQTSSDNFVKTTIVLKSRS